MGGIPRYRDMAEAIQEYADKHCEGNFSMAVRVLIKKGLAEMAH